MNSTADNRLLGRAIKAAALLATLLACAPCLAETGTGVIKISSRPQGCDVTVDGVKKGTTPLLLELEEGSHQLVVGRRGYKTSKRKIAVKKDMIARAHVVLKAVPGQAPDPSPDDAEREIVIHQPDENAPPGTVTIVTTPPGLTVFMDDHLIPQPTPVAFDLRPGPYRLVIEDDGEVVHEKTVFVQPAKTLALDLTIKKVRKIDYSDPWE